MSTGQRFPPTIYVNSAMLPRCVGKTVRAIGRVSGVAAAGSVGRRTHDIGPYDIRSGGVTRRGATGCSWSQLTEAP